MQYFGGKAKIAKRLVAAMRPEHIRGVAVWEPFCGGLNMTRALAGAGALVLATDANQALISLYRAVAAGWDPPSELTSEQWQAAKMLPDSDPLKAFAGFGCSFGGKWFRGYSRRSDSNVAISARRNIRAAVPSAAGFDVADFVQTQPWRPSHALTLYCDPPYAGTEGDTCYEPQRRTGRRWDAIAFWERAEEWSRICPVYVSEYQSPGWQIVAAIEQGIGMVGKTGTRTERLFYRGPECRR